MVIYLVLSDNMSMNGSKIELKLAKRLRQLRKKQRLTQEAVSERAGISVRHYQQLESSKPHAVQLNTLEKLAKAFKITPSKLLDF